MIQKAVLAAVALALAAGMADAQTATPRKGGTLRMTAPYGTSLSSLDIHTTPRAQDGIVAKLIHRSLYKWDTAANKPVLELAAGVTVSNGGLTHTFKLRDDAVFHNDRKMTADDIIFSYTRIMDSTKGYPGARWIRNIKGAVEVEKNQAKEIAGLKKIDDGTLEITLNEKIDPGFFLMHDNTSILAKENVEGGDITTTRSASGRSSSRSICRARGSSPSAGTSSTSRASPISTA